MIVATFRTDFHAEDVERAKESVILRVLSVLRVKVFLGSRLRFPTFPVGLPLNPK